MSKNNVKQITILTKPGNPKKQGGAWAMVRKRLNNLQTERDILVDRWKNTKSSDKTKILVQIMDLDEYIDKVIREDKAIPRKSFH